MDGLAKKIPLANYRTDGVEAQGAGPSKKLKLVVATQGPTEMTAQLGHFKLRGSPKVINRERDLEPCLFFVRQ